MYQVLLLSAVLIFPSIADEGYDRDLYENQQMTHETAPQDAFVYVSSQHGEESTYMPLNLFPVR